MSTGGDAFSPVDELLEDLSARLRAGESLDLEQIVRLHPEHEVELRRLLPVMSLLEGASTAPSLPMPPSSAPALPAHIGPYRVVREIGRGGMGRVFEAKSPAGKRVAVKVIHAHLLDEPRHRERFLIEAEIGQRVSHPSIVETLDTDACVLQGTTTPYIVLEYVEGQTLRALIDDVGAVPERLASLIGQRVAAALHVLHENGVVHRDVKPENVVITSDETVKLMDLGVSFLQDRAARLSRVGEFVGSLLYAAPEQVRGTEPGPAADLYALGLLLFELATAQHAFQQSGGIHRPLVSSGTAPAPANVRAELTPFFDAVVKSLLDPNPETRLGTAADVETILAQRERSEWWMHRAQETPHRRRLLPVDDWVSFQGRTDELETLTRLSDACIEGRGHALVIEAEGGIGKSRLLAEWLKGLGSHADAPRIGVAGYAPGAMSLALPPLDEAMKHLLEGEDSLSRLRELLGDDSKLPEFAHRYIAGTDGLDDLTLPNTARFAIYERILIALSVERPVVLIMEDMHFGDPIAWDVFRGYCRTLPRARILLIGTTRPPIAKEVRAELTKNPSASILTLAGLEEPAVRALLGEALGERAARTTAAQALAQMSDGSPFCVLEFARELRRRNREDADKSTASSLQRITIPDSVQQIVDERLEALDAQSRELLSLAACSSERWDPDVICQTLDIPRLRGLRTFLDLDLQHGLIRSEDETYRFRHHLVQEALYEQLTPTLRRAYHGALADVMEKGEPDAFALARHRLLADQVEEAAPFLRAGMNQLEQSGEYARAERMARRVHEASDRIPRDVHAHALGVIGRAIANRAPADACDMYQRALDMAPDDDLPLRARIATSLGSALEHAGKAHASKVALKQAIELSRKAGDRALEGAGIGRLALTQLRLGESEAAKTSASEALRLARQGSDPWQFVATAISVGEIELALGHAATVRTLSQEAYDVAFAHADRRGQLLALHLLGRVARMEGRLDASIQLLERTRELARETGNIQREAGAWISRNILLSEVGRTAEAVAESREVLAFTKGYHQETLQCYATMMLGVSLVIRGQMSEAEVHLAHAIQGATDMSHALLVQKASLHRSGVMLVTGRAKEGSDILAHIEKGSATEADSAAFANVRALVHEATGQPAKGHALLAKAITVAPDAKPYNAARLHLVAARLALRAKNDDAARDHLDVVLQFSRNAQIRPITALALLLRGALPHGELLAARVALEDHASAMPFTDRLMATELVARRRDDPELRERARADLDAYLGRVPEAYRLATAASPLFCGDDGEST